MTAPQAPAWTSVLYADPLPWLLEDEAPAVRRLALVQLLGRAPDDAEVLQARDAAMRSGPIAAMLRAQQPDGYWLKPGPGYAPKYRATVWQLIFLDQMGADAGDPRVRAACEYVLEHSQAESGGFGASGNSREERPRPSLVIHCLSGNLLRALIGFGLFDDDRVQAAIDWQARAITGEGQPRYYDSGTSGPGFGCAMNQKLPCAWGAIKAVRALARIPAERRTAEVRRALHQGTDFLLGRDPAVADYPMRPGNTAPSALWFRLGFPSGYVADVLQNLETLCELGFAADARLQHAYQWLLSRQDMAGRWLNHNAYNGRTWGTFEKQGQPSRWVTLRACSVIKAAWESGGKALLSPARREAAAP